MAVVNSPTGNVVHTLASAAERQEANCKATESLAIALSHISGKLGGEGEARASSKSSSAPEDAEETDQDVVGRLNKLAARQNESISLIILEIQRIQSLIG